MAKAADSTRARVAHGSHPGGAKRNIDRGTSDAAGEQLTTVSPSPRTSEKPAMSRPATVRRLQSIKGQNPIADLAVAQLKAVDRRPPAITAEPLSPIERAWRALPAAKRAVFVANRLFDEADERWLGEGRPESPDALIIAGVDRYPALLHRCPHRELGADHSRGFVRRAIPYWTTELLKEALSDPEPKFCPLGAPSGERALAERRDRLEGQLKASVAHDSAERRWYRTSGMAQACRKSDLARSALYRLLKSLATSPAGNIRDLGIKAKVLASMCRQKSDYRYGLNLRPRLRASLARSVDSDVRRMKLI